MGQDDWLQWRLAVLHDLSSGRLCGASLHPLCLSSGHASGIWDHRVTGWDYGDDIYPYGSNRYNLVTNIVSSSQHGIFYGYNDGYSYGFVNDMVTVTINMVITCYNYYP